MLGLKAKRGENRKTINLWTVNGYLFPNPEPLNPEPVNGYEYLLYVNNFQRIFFTIPWKVKNCVFFCEQWASRARYSGPLKNRNLWPFVLNFNPSICLSLKYLHNNISTSVDSPPPYPLPQGEGDNLPTHFEKEPYFSIKKLQ